MYECSKLNGSIVVMTKDTCYFRLDRVWNIHVETTSTENSISRFLDFNIFWGSNLPQETPRGWCLWRSQYFPLLRNIRISTNTPSQTPATHLKTVFSLLNYFFLMTLVTRSVNQLVICIWLMPLWCSRKLNNRELKQLRRRPQGQLQKKNNRFNDKNNSSARATRFLVHFIDVHCTTTTWNLLIWRFMEDVDIRRRIFLPLFEPE